MAARPFDEIQREMGDLHDNMMDSNSALLKSYRDLYASRESLIRLGRTEDALALQRNRKQIENTNSFSKLMVEKEREIGAERVRVFNVASETILEDWIGKITGLADVTRATFQEGLKNLSSGIADEMVDGTYDWNKAMKDVLKVMIRMTTQMMIMKTIALSTGGIMGGLAGLLFHDGGIVMHQGGRVPRRYHHGAMLGQNEVPAVLERGEFVVNKRAVKRPGTLRKLELMNSGRDDQPRGQGVGVSNSYHFTIHAIDTENMESAIFNKIIPILEDAERRGVYRPGNMGF